LFQGLARFGLSRIYDIWKLSQPADERKKGECILALLSVPTDVLVFAAVVESNALLVVYLIFPHAVIG